MSDRTYCQMEAKDLSLAVATLVTAAFYAEDGYSGAELVGMAKDLMGGETLSIEEIPCGYSDDLFNAILAVIKETGIDFRFRLWEDPKYEWLGTMHYHIPGMDDVSASCGTGGDIQISGQAITDALVRSVPAYNLEDWVRNAACITEVQAWNA